MDDASATSPSSATARFAARVLGGDAAERLAAEAWEAGACGIEERGEDVLIELVIYASAGRAEAVRREIVTTGIAETVGALERLPETDWSEDWKRGLGELEISPRLLVRPSFVTATAKPGQRVLVIDPGQAFGTGSHESTRLALEWIDALRDDLQEGCRVLDVGTGTGLLALAAVALLGARCVGFDVDPRATEAARENAGANDMTAHCHVFTGPLDAVAGDSFDLVLANLLKNEMLPLLPGIAGLTRPGGRVVLAGLLEHEARVVTAAAEAAGLARAEERALTDANGDRWVSLLMLRPRAASSRREALRGPA